MALLFTLLSPMHSNASAASDGEVNDYNFESTEKTTPYIQLVETELELVKPDSTILNPDFALEETELYVDSEISPMCGPPCGLIAVIAVRAIVSGVTRAVLKNSAGKTIKTVVPAPRGAAANAVKSYTTKSHTINGKTYTVVPERMEHFLKRHSMNHWDGSWAPSTANQTFFYEGMTIQRIDQIILNGLKHNASKLPTSGFKQVEYTYNGIEYVIGIDGSSRRVTQFYPKKTYVNPN